MAISSFAVAGESSWYAPIRADLWPLINPWAPKIERSLPVSEAQRTHANEPWEAAYEHPAGIWKREWEIVSNFSSGIDPLGALLAEHLEDDAAEVTSKGADGLIVLLAFGAFFLVVALRLRDPFTMVIDGHHHRPLGAGVDMLGRL